MLILAFSASSEILSVALINKDKLIGEENYFVGLRHSEKLLSAIKNILNISSFSISDIDAFAIDIGPGSFTGLRISLATLKGLVFGEQKKIIGVSSLDVLTENAIQSQPFISNSLICPIIDAKQDRVYSAIYEITKSGQLKRKTDYSAIKIKDLLISIRNNPLMTDIIDDSKVIFLGDGLQKYQDFIFQKQKKAIFLARKFWFPYASVVAKLGIECLKRGKEDNIDSLLPMYLVPPMHK